MTKTKKDYSCVECGHLQVKWAGQCPSCDLWNTFVEEVTLPIGRFETAATKPLKLSEIKEKKVQRISTSMGEFNRLIGGGVVPGSLTLIGGDPGVGKSTLMLQLSDSFAKLGLTVLYVCGEESCEQTLLRAKRLTIESENLYLLNETNYAVIRQHVEELNPSILIIDSIQIVYKPEVSSSPGSVSQVREVTCDLMHLSKGRNLATFVIGHVTKAGEIAGPKILEHLVDTVLYFEGDRQRSERLIRVVKNRFGPTDEIGVFQMIGSGLKEVSNPSEIFLEERQRGVIGSIIIPTVEGTRPLMIEAQALVTPTGFSTPTRKCSGIDPNRLALLLAVLEKKVGFHFHQCDVFVSIAGGMKIKEPATDLGLLLAIASSWKNIPIDPDTVVIGEVGLAGEVRSSPKMESRLKEAALLGFKRAIIPKKCLKGLKKGSIDVLGVEKVEQALSFSLSKD
ncbi:DNA repair protein RadA [Chlamydiales bacterium]|nr:DNA repair protein RadA [Chlamydiales bacterium]